MCFDIFPVVTKDLKTEKLWITWYEEASSDIEIQENDSDIFSEHSVRKTDTEQSADENMSDQLDLRPASTELAATVTCKPQFF